MHRHARGRFSDIALADALGNIAPVEQGAVSAYRGLELNARFLREFYQRGFVVKRYVVIDGLQRQSAVHRPALQVDIAKLARQAGGDRALARARRAVDGNDQFALRVLAVGVVVHFASRRLYTESKTGT
jgi:hypothetical protein